MSPSDHALTAADLGRLRIDGGPAHRACRTL